MVMGVERTAGGNAGWPKLGRAAGEIAGGSTAILLAVEGREKVLAHTKEDTKEGLAVGEGGCEAKGLMTSLSGEQKLLKRGD